LCCQLIIEVKARGRKFIHWWSACSMEWMW